MGKSSLQHLYGLTILLVLFTSGSVLHRHLPLRYTASFAHTWCDPARGTRWHHFLPLSKYIPPFRSTGKKTKQTHAVGSCFHNQRRKNRHALIDLFRCGWMLVLRFSSPMQLVLGFLPLLEVTTLIKMTVTGRHSLLKTVATVLPVHRFYIFIFWFLFAFQGLFLLVFIEQCHQHCGGLCHFFRTGFHDLWTRSGYFWSSWIRQVLTQNDCLMKNCWVSCRL